MRKNVQVFARKIGDNPNKKAFYARLWDSETEKYSKTTSIAKLQVLLGDRSGKTITSRRTAEKIAQEAYHKGIFKNVEEEKDEVTFDAYASKIWNYDESPYIRRKNHERPNSITRVYADAQLDWLRREVFPNIPANLKLSKFTPAMAEKIKDKMLDDGKASSSINKVLQAIRTPLNEAYRLGMLSEDIAGRIKNMTVTNKKKGILSVEEALKLEKYFKESTAQETYERNKFLIISLAIRTGMREGEIRALMAADIIIKENETPRIDVRHAYNDKDKLKCTKGKEERINPINPDLASELLEYSKFNPNGFIFFSLAREKTPVCPKSILKWFKEGLIAIGIGEEEQKRRNITFHSLRHGFATATRDAGLPNESRKALVGHKSDSMLYHYTKETDRHMQDLLRQIESIFPYEF